ncbi:Spo7-like protein-domain-containing protein [Cristinia sonorae]|uniref:Transmembrane protein 188 n=1 Tax=Cristinia sonorae TaxID=1940300 RepID=A0A8K0USM4_9AGAR|nr:Spo7-like protein-domain-containing protein [Cristinia sonorae]
MPPRLPPIPTKGAFYPANDSSTYRDLLFFEERLKSNAASLNRRKHRYQLFLSQLLLIILFLLSEVFLQTEFLEVPCRWIIRLVVPERFRKDAEWEVHQYLAVGLLCVYVTTLALFFVSGMYSEKIEYANRYVPHANRALRNFNMYLNVRQPPLRSKLPFNPFSFLFPRTSPSILSSAPSPTSSSRRRSPSPHRPSKRSSSVPIPPIPPTSNPRGELIFSSRVDRSFREGYDRHRTTFERMRMDKERIAYQSTRIGWLHSKLMGLPLLSSPSSSSTAPSGTATPVGNPGISRAGSASGSGSLRGRVSSGGSVPGTPSSSRKSSPAPHKISRKAPVGRTGTPPRQSPLQQEAGLHTREWNPAS